MHPNLCAAPSGRTLAADTNRSGTMRAIQNATNCTVLTDDDTACGKPSTPEVPFSVCAEHAVQVYRCLSRLMSERAHGSDPTMRINALADVPQRGRSVQYLNGDAMNGWPAVIYYATLGDQIKIGWTRNVANRMRDYPPAIRLLAVEPGDHRLEKYRHGQFKHLLAAGNEWFHPGNDLIEHIRQLDALGLEAAPPP